MPKFIQNIPLLNVFYVSMYTVRILHMYVFWSRIRTFSKNDVTVRALRFDYGDFGRNRKISQWKFFFPLREIVL